MKQPIVGGYPDNLQVNSAVTEYNCLMGGAAWVSTENNVYQCIPTNGKFRKLYVELNGDPTAGGSYYDFWLVVNGTPSALTCRIAAGATANSDLTHEVSVTAGQTVSICCTPSATDPTARMARWTCEFESDTPNESICLISAPCQNSYSTYPSLQGASLIDNSTENRVSTPIPTAGSFKKLYIQLSGSPGVGAGDAYTIALRVGAGTKNNTVTITQPATSGNITNVTDAVVAGNLVNFICIAVSTPSLEPFAAIGIVFCPTVDGESLLTGGDAGSYTPNNDVTYYHQLCETRLSSWQTTEYFSLIQACLVRNFYVSLSVAPDTGNDYTISINKDAGAASGLTVNIAGAATTGNDVAHTYIAGNGDTISLKSVPNSTPTISYQQVGLVLYIDPTPTRFSYYPHILAH